jgi:hypothetical protein
MWLTHTILIYVFHPHNSCDYAHPHRFSGIWWLTHLFWIYVAHPTIHIYGSPTRFLIYVAHQTIPDLCGFTQATSLLHVAHPTLFFMWLTHTFFLGFMWLTHTILIMWLTHTILIMWLSPHDALSGFLCGFTVLMILWIHVAHPHTIPDLWVSTSSDL